MVPKTVFEDRTCVPGTVQNGPKHNKIPDPSRLPHEDNNSMWVPNSRRRTTTRCSTASRASPSGSART
ncbi:hypothetical protein NKG94_33150 [Micromonospora sp. M12]